MHRIHAETTRMARLVEDLLLLARADDDGLRLRHEDVDLDDLVYAERERIALQHPRLRVGGEIHPVRVPGDADALHRALRNLVDNATRHARHRVTLTLHARRTRAQIVVANDGEPIAASDRARIFDRFVRLDDSRSRTAGGAGLGLSIARELVVAHGGSLAVDDRSHGAAMRMLLHLTWLADWCATLRRHVVAGATVRRARIVSEPLSEYQRWSYSIARPMVSAGEDIRWIPRTLVSSVAVPGNDFYLFDDRLVVFLHYAGSGLGTDRVTSTDPADLDLAGQRSTRCGSSRRPTANTNPVGSAKSARQARRYTTPSGADL
ncbi:hypothetical protein KRMM14A1259_04980 [Krasilnikovia sp. MM14-A1259]